MLAENNRVTLVAAPSPRPDEILYSWAGTLIRRNALSPSQHALRLLMGGKMRTLSMDLPTGLVHFYEVLGSFSGIGSVSDLIDRTTLYPYHRPFIDQRRDSTVTNRMLQGDGRGNGLKTLLGRVANRFGAHTKLRFCPTCVITDIERYGEAYWRRAWLLPDVTHCIAHAAPLVTQHAGARPSNPFEAIAVDRGGAVGVSTAPGNALTLRLSKISVDLLEANLPPIGPQKLGLTYRRQADRFGYVSTSGSIRLQSLVADIRNQFNDFDGFEHRDRFLSSPRNPMSWVATIFRRPDRAVHPLCHLVLIDHLFGSIAAWQEALVSYPRVMPKVQQPLGSHTRPCVSAPEVHDPSLSCREAARRAGLSTNTVVNLRHELGMQVALRPRSATRSAQGDILRNLSEGKTLSEVAAASQVSLATVSRMLRRFPMIREARARAVAQSQRTGARIAWLNAIQHANGVTSARIRAPGAYAWLRRHDLAWLESQHPDPPQINTSRYGNSRVNWENRDLEISRKLHDLVESKGLLPSTRRRSPYLLLRLLNVQTLVVRNWMNLPRTFDALIVCAESTSEWHERRLRCAAEELWSLNQPIRLERLMRAAHINRSYSEFARQWLEKWQPPTLDIAH
jgi:transposase